MGMKVFQKEFSISSSKRIELIDVTSKVERIVKSSGIEDGLCTIFVPHATAAVLLNENENGLVSDMETHIKKIFPASNEYAHNRIDNNAGSHIASAFIGQSRTLPVKGDMVVRGTWQNIFVVELDGPRRSRRVVVTIIGV